MVRAGALLLDVRSPGEYAGGHLGGAINIPVDQLASRISELPAGKKIVVYCASGVRSAQAASLLDGRKFEVFDMGGMGEWGR